ncbi:MAG: acetyl-CoA C-acyltransferase [Methanothrix sp.]
MEEAYILEILRSPVGKFLSGLSELSATDLAVQVVTSLMEKSGVKNESIDGIIAGNVLSAGLGQNPAKQVIVNSKLPKSIPTLNVNMVCASGLKAVSLAAESIQAGNSNIIIAGGMESMSNAPHTLKGLRKFRKLGPISLEEAYGYAKTVHGKNFELEDEMIKTGLWDCYSDMHMGAIAEKIGTKYSISREEQDKFALESHRKAAAAADSGMFNDEIVGIKLGDGSVFDADEGIRRDTNLESLSKLKPAFVKDGTVTAGNASQLSDGAAFAIVISGKKLKELGLKPLAKIESYADAGIDPQWYGLSPKDSMEHALSKSGHNLEDMDLIEVNEAFCVQVLGVVKEMGIDMDKLNVNGGATALGHPIGASGARLLATLAHALQKRRKRFGIVSLCHGGGGSSSMVISRVD